VVGTNQALTLAQIEAGMSKQTYAKDATSEMRECLEIFDVSGKGTLDIGEFRSVSNHTPPPPPPL
jgi:Ca2+-binding EF-hand superfamily protein